MKAIDGEPSASFHWRHPNLPAYRFAGLVVRFEKGAARNQAELQILPGATEAALLLDRLRTRVHRVEDLYARRNMSTGHDTEGGRDRLEGVAAAPEDRCEIVLVDLGLVVNSGRGNRLNTSQRASFEFASWLVHMPPPVGNLIIVSVRIAWWLLDAEQPVESAYRSDEGRDRTESPNRLSVEGH